MYEVYRYGAVREAVVRKMHGGGGLLPSLHLEGGPWRLVFGAGGSSEGGRGADGGGRASR